MATIQEYFQTDLTDIFFHDEWPLRNAAGETFPAVTVRNFQNFDSNAKYWGFFIPEGVDAIAYAKALFALPLLSTGSLNPVQITLGWIDSSEKASSDALVFTKRIFLYVDAVLGDAVRSEIVKAGSLSGFDVLVRDKEWAENRSKQERPLAFISHDSRDKSALVRDLALQMSQLKCPVWYDEYSLKIGDNLRTSIEKGLKEASKCIVILSPNFFSNEGWGKAEFDSIYMREILEKTDVILPIWHNVSAEEVYRYSPRLAGKVALNSSLGVKELALRLMKVLR